MKRVLCLLSLLVFATCAHAAPRAQVLPRGEDLMRAMMNARRTVGYSATETWTREGAPTVISKVRRQGDRERVEYSSPAIMRGDVMVDDGNVVWRFHRAENSALKTKDADQYRASDWNALRRRIEAKTLGQTSINGRRAWLVAVSPRGKTQVMRRLWIDAQTKLRLRAERFDNAGKRVETWALSNLKIQNFPASTWKYAPPRGAQVTDAGVLYLRLNQAQRAANWLRAPQTLPRGYGFESAVVDAQKGESWLRYSSGTRRFSIFQQRTQDPKSTPLKPVGGGWYWKAGGSRFLIAGLSQSLAERVAGSMK